MISPISQLSRRILRGAMGTWLASLLVSLSISAICDATPTIVAFPESSEVPANTDGWQFGLKLGASTDWKAEQYRPGIDSGHYWTVGLLAVGTTNYLHNDFQWRGKLTVGVGYNKTPSDDRFIKTADELSLETSNYWAFGGWWGSFGLFRYDTSMMQGIDVQRNPVTYNITDINGNVTSIQGDTLVLNEPFLPSYLTQAIGLFFRPITYDFFKTEFRIGVYAREVFTDGQLFVLGKSNNIVDVKTLSTYYELGPLVGSTIAGDIVPKTIFYNMSLGFGYPVWVTSAVPIGTDFVDRVTGEVTTEVTIKPFTWLNLTWSFKGIYMPEIVEGFQYDSKFVASFPLIL